MGNNNYHYCRKERKHIGGILGGLPSTSAFSFFFIGINQSSTAAVQATTVFPLAFGITTAYLFFYSFFAKKSFSRGIIISMIIWFALSGLVVASGLNDFALSLAGGIVISSFTYYCFTKKIKLQNFRGEKRDYKISEVVLRGVGAGSLVLLSVFLSQIGGPVLGGIAAAFPAVFTSTLIIVNKTMGTEFSRSITKPLVLSGILTIIPFSTAVRFLYPSFGIWFGTLVAYALVIPLVVLSYYAVQHQGEKRN